MEVEQAWIAPIVKAELEKVKNRVLKKDRDFVLVIDGEEGVGKSVLAQQFAGFLDPEFNLDKIVFTADQFIELIKNPKTKKGSAIVLDEAFSAASARAALTEVNRAMIAVATEMRQRNLFVIMCLPSFFDLDRYFALWRCRALVHCFFDYDEDRKYVLFPKDHKKHLYLLGKKTYAYSKPQAPFPPFTFPNHYLVNEQQYRLKKQQAFMVRERSIQSAKQQGQRDALIFQLIEKEGKSPKEVQDILYKAGYPIHHSNIYRIHEKYLEKTTKFAFASSHNIINTPKL